MVGLLLDRGADMEAKNNVSQFAGVLEIQLRDALASWGRCHSGKLSFPAGTGEQSSSGSMLRAMVLTGRAERLTSQNGFTALIAAASNGHSDVVEFLLVLNANVEAKDKASQVVAPSFSELASA